MSGGPIDDLRVALRSNRGVAFALSEYLAESEKLARTKAALIAVEAMKAGDDKLTRQGLHQLGTADALKTVRETVRAYANLTDD